MPLPGGRSTLDVAGQGFAVLTANDSDDWRKVAEETQRVLNVLIAVQSVTEPNVPGTVLVRPDGVIAWCTSKPAEAAGLQRAMSDVLHRLT